MTANLDTYIMGAIAIGALAFGIYNLIKVKSKSENNPPNYEFPFESMQPSLASRLQELGRLFNILFDYAGSRTVIIGKLVLVYNDKGISVRVQDPRLPPPNIEIAFFEEEDQEMRFYLSDTSDEKREKIIEWIRSQIESEITKRKTELDNALTIIASIMDEEPSDPLTSME